MALALECSVPAESSAAVTQHHGDTSCWMARPWTEAEPARCVTGPRPDSGPGRACCQSLTRRARASLTTRVVTGSSCRSATVSMSCHSPPLARY